MPQFRKKPVVIDAIPVAELLPMFKGNWPALPDWVREAYEAGPLVAVTDRGFTIKTLEGDLHATADDILIRGVKGELYPCKRDIFEATYEPV